MPKPTKPKPKHPARCRCGRFHGFRYRQLKGAPPHCFLPLGAIAHVPELYEVDAPKVDLSKPPYLCPECIKHEHL